MADNSDAALRIGKFTEAAVGIAIDVAQNTIKHNTWYKSYASLDSHIRGQLESDVNYRWPAYADISDRRTKKTIIAGVRQKLIEKDIIDFETLPTPTPQPIAITPFEERFALYTAKAEIIASYFKPEPGASLATTKLLEMQVKSFMDENYPEFHYGTLNNEERSYNAKLINTSAVQREVLRKAAELIAERSAGPVVAKPSEKADGLPFHQSPAFETENSEQPPAREKEITGPVRHCNSFLNNTAFNGSGEDLPNTAFSGSGEDLPNTAFSGSGEELPNTAFNGFGEASLNTALPEFGKDTLSTAPAGFVGSAPPAPSTSLVQGALT